MDPASLVALIEGSVGLVIQCGGIVKTLSDIAARYKASELSIMSMAQSLDVIQLAWSRIKDWSQAQWFSLHLNSDDDAFIQRLNRSLDIGKMVMAGLQEDLRPYQSDSDVLTFKQRSKAVWNQDALRNHQDRIRDQAASMTLLLQAIQLNSPVDRKEFLHEATPILRKSDESAITIVPSEPSNLSISTQSTASLVYPTMKLVYHPLSFEDELFTARVYKRNYGHSLLHQLLKPKVPTSQWTQDESASAVSSVATDRPRRITGGNDDLPIAIKAPMRVLGTSPRRPSHREAFSPPGELPDFQDFNGKDWAEQEKSSKGQKYNKTCGGPGGPLLLTNWEAPTTPLIEACKGRGSLSLESVIERGESVHTQLQGKIVILTAIHVATIYGQFQALYTLLHHGANVDELAEATEENFVYAGWRPLHFATRGDQSMCLLEHGANVSAKSLCGHQPIHIAAFNCDVGILHILLNHSAQINAKANCGRTPLHLARANSRVNIARDFPIWTGKLDVEPLMKPAFIEAIVSWNQAVRQKFSSPNTQRPRNDTMPAQSVLLTLDYHGGPPLSSLDIAFFRLFLTSEEAEHGVSFKIVSRWYVKSEATNSLASGMKLLSPKSVHFLDSVATFYGTAPVYERKIISAKNRDSREKGKGIYMLYFTIIREEYKIRTILSRMRLGFLKT